MFNFIFNNNILQLCMFDINLVNKNVLQLYFIPKLHFFQPLIWSVFGVFLCQVIPAYLMAQNMMSHDWWNPCLLTMVIQHVQEHFWQELICGSLMIRHHASWTMMDPGTTVCMMESSMETMNHEAWQPPHTCVWAQYSNLAKIGIVLT